MDDSVKAAFAVGGIGIALIAIAGILTAADHVKGSRSRACALPAAFVGKTSAVPQILSLEAGSDDKSPVIQLGRPACITVAGIRSADELTALRSAVQSSQSDMAQTGQQLKQASDAMASAAADARAAAQQRVTDLKARLAERTTALTQARDALNTAAGDVELALFLDGRETPARANAAGVAEAQALRFTLEPVNDAHSDDAARVRRILGGLLSGAQRDVAVGVGLPSASRPLAQWTPSASARNAQLKVYAPLAAGMAGVGFLLLLIAIYLAGRTTTLLRDGDNGSTFSLGRTQMAFWMIATVFGFVFIWVLTGQYRNVVTAATFTLLGITGATALASRAIDGNAAPPGSRGFAGDILSDSNGTPQLHRVQVAIWTLVLGTIYIWNVLDGLVLTEFDTNLLILVGIANGVYAGFKTREA